MRVAKPIALSDAYWFQEGPGLRNWQFKASGIKILNVGNILPDGTIDLSKTDRHLSEEEFSTKYQHFNVDAGDLVIASSGISFDGDGLLRTKIAFIEEAHLPLCMNTSTIRFKAKDQFSDLNYLRHWLQSAEFRRQVSRLVTGSAQLNFGPSHLKSMVISLPPLSEQRRIAAILDKADALRRQRQRAIDLLDSLTQSIFLEMFGDGTTHWSSARFGDAVEEFRYGTSAKSEAEGYPVLRIPNVVGGRVDLGELKYVPLDQKEYARLKLDSGDLLIVRTNGNRAYVGRCAVFDPTRISHRPTEHVYASYLIRARLKSAEFDPHFVQAFLSSEMGRKALLDRSKTSAGQFNINTEGLGTIEIPKPPIEMQKDFATRLGMIRKSEQALAANYASTAALFASLQSRAFAGEL